ncbi:MAG: hypothetical protein V1777_00345 [Candidatus Micrarchaeota archaeon]
MKTGCLCFFLVVCFGISVLAPTLVPIRFDPFQNFSYSVSNNRNETLSPIFSTDESDTMYAAAFSQNDFPIRVFYRVKSGVFSWKNGYYEVVSIRQNNREQEIFVGPRQSFFKPQLIVSFAQSGVLENADDSIEIPMQNASEKNLQTLLGGKNALGFFVSRTGTLKPYSIDPSSDLEFKVEIRDQSRNNKTVLDGSWLELFAGAPKSFHVEQSRLTVFEDKPSLSDAKPVSTVLLQKKKPVTVCVAEANPSQSSPVPPAATAAPNPTAIVPNQTTVSLVVPPQPAALQPVPVAESPIVAVETQPSTVFRDPVFGTENCFELSAEDLASAYYAGDLQGQTDAPQNVFVMAQTTDSQGQVVSQGKTELVLSPEPVASDASNATPLADAVSEANPADNSSLTDLQSKISGTFQPLTDFFASLSKKPDSQIQADEKPGAVSGVSSDTATPARQRPPALEPALILDAKIASDSLVISFTPDRFEWEKAKSVFGFINDTPVFFLGPGFRFNGSDMVTITVPFDNAQAITSEAGDSVQRLNAPEISLDKPIRIRVLVGNLDGVGILTGEETVIKPQTAPQVQEPNQSFVSTADLFIENPATEMEWEKIPATDFKASFCLSNVGQVAEIDRFAGPLILTMRLGGSASEKSLVLGQWTLDEAKAGDSCKLFEPSALLNALGHQTTFEVTGIKNTDENPQLVVLAKKTLEPEGLPVQLAFSQVLDKQDKMLGRFLLPPAPVIVEPVQPVVLELQNINPNRRLFVFASPVDNPKSCYDLGLAISNVLTENSEEQRSRLENYLSGFSRSELNSAEQSLLTNSLMDFSDDKKSAGFVFGEWKPVVQAMIAPKSDLTIGGQNPLVTIPNAAAGSTGYSLQIEFKPASAAVADWSKLVGKRFVFSACQFEFAVSRNPDFFWAAPSAETAPVQVQFGKTNPQTLLDALLLVDNRFMDRLFLTAAEKDAKLKLVKDGKELDQVPSPNDTGSAAACIKLGGTEDDLASLKLKAISSLGQKPLTAVNRKAAEEGTCASFLFDSLLGSASPVQVQLVGTNASGKEKVIAEKTLAPANGKLSEEQIIQTAPVADLTAIISNPAEFNGKILKFSGLVKEAEKISDGYSFVLVLAPLAKDEAKVLYLGSETTQNNTLVDVWGTIEGPASVSRLITSSIARKK